MCLVFSYSVNQKRIKRTVARSDVFSKIISFPTLPFAKTLFQTN